uniref:Transmembrane protein n=1 Tax=Steinernema glaseri TaxID=37863 RepID=A0A1I7Z704_9BILA
MAGMAGIMMSSTSFWFAFILIPITTLIPDFVLKGIRTTVSPSPRDLACISERNARKASGYFPQSARVAYATNLPPARPRAVSELSETHVLNGCTTVPEVRGPYGSTEMIQLGQDAENAAYYNAAASTLSLAGSSSFEPPAEEPQSNSLTERARLLRVRQLQSDSSSIALEDQALHGYAFSQEEGGAMAQTELIRNSDSTRKKPQGL